jgi:hypothetical protein
VKNIRYVGIDSFDTDYHEFVWSCSPQRVTGEYNFNKMITWRVSLQSYAFWNCELYFRNETGTHIRQNKIFCTIMLFIHLP